MWLIFKQLEKIEFDRVQRNSAEEVLYLLKERKTTYSKAYQILCKSVLHLFYPKFLTDIASEILNDE